MKDFLKNNLLIVLLYLCTAGAALYFLLHYDKTVIYLYINSFVGNQLADLFFYYVTYLGDGRIAGLILLGILFYNVRLGIYAISSFLSATIVATTLKYLYFDDENRPFYLYSYFVKADINYVDGVDLHLHNSFPSGHATQAFAILMCLAFASKSQLVKFLLFALAVLTSFSRVYLSQHWLLDVTAGSFIGMCFSLLYYYFFIYHNKFSKLNRTLYSLRTS